MTPSRRWNGWGDARVQEALKPEAQAFLAQAVGQPQPLPDATLAEALAQVDAQPTRLPRHPLIDTRAETRLRASFGQSMHDWLRLRFGVLGRVTDGVAFPDSAAGCACCSPGHASTACRCCRGTAPPASRAT